MFYSGNSYTFTTRPQSPRTPKRRRDTDSPQLELAHNPPAVCAPHGRPAATHQATSVVAYPWHRPPFEMWKRLQLAGHTPSARHALLTGYPELRLDWPLCDLCVAPFPDKEKRLRALARAGAVTSAAGCVLLLVAPLAVGAVVAATGLGVLVSAWLRREASPRVHPGHLTPDGAFLVVPDPHPVFVRQAEQPRTAH